MLSQEASSTIFCCLWYDSTWDWTSVDRAMGKNSTHYFNLYIYMYIYKLSAWPIYDIRSIFKRNVTGLNSEFSFYQHCHTKADEYRLPYYFHIVGGRIVRFIPFPEILTLCEIKTPSSSLWTWAPCPFPATITMTPKDNSVLISQNMNPEHLCTSSIY